MQAADKAKSPAEAPSAEEGPGTIVLLTAAACRGCVPKVT